MRSALSILVLFACLGSAPQAQDSAADAERASRLQGRASLGRNQHVTGATVLVSPADEASRIFVSATDSTGRFRIDGLPDGEYHVELRREGLESIVKKNVVLRFPARAVIEVTMKEAVEPPARTALPASRDEPVDEAELVTVSGRVTHDGRPLPDVRLRFVRRDGRVDPFTVRSSREGSFGPDRVPAGPWRLQADLVGFLPIWISVDLVRDSELTVTMVPQPVSHTPSPLELMPQEQPIPPGEVARDSLE